MNMKEVKRLILWLQAAGWPDNHITKILLYLETGEDKYFPADEDKDKQA